jgi:hypothetical protein
MRESKEIEKSEGSEEPEQRGYFSKRKLSRVEGTVFAYSVK